MLALWSRATRTPGTCRCISCASKHVAVAARANGTGGLLLRNPTSTFVYTTIFTAALATDAQSKRKRNEQWDKAFEQLREEIGKPDSTEKDTDHLEPMEELLASLDWDTVSQAVGMDLVEDKVLDEIQSETKSNVEHLPESFWSLLAYDTRFPNSGIPNPQWPANTGPNLIRHHLPPQSLWSPEHMRWTAVRKRQTWKKLAIQELSIGILIHALLDNVQASRLPTEVLKSLAPDIESIALLTSRENRQIRRRIKKSLEIIHKTDVYASDEIITHAKRQTKGPSVPSYSQDSDGQFYETTQHLNNALRGLLKGTPEDRRNEDGDQHRLAVAKICHNLLASTAAPDVQTFNILMAGFKRRGLHRLVNDTIGAFNVCKIRPNEITCAAILDHYVQVDQPEYFSRFVAHMRGVDNALMLARPDIQINEMGQSRLVRRNDKKVWQKVYPTPAVFNALMSGVLHFAGFDRAVDIYLEMKEDGWGLDTPCLSQFLLDCVKRRDWNGGLLIWQEITSINELIRPTHMTIAYANMLGLCSATGNTVAFNRLLSDVARRGYDRKSIMASAVRISREAQMKSGNIAPAWAADNLLIAVSDYMHDGKSTESDTEDPGFETAFEEDTDVRFWNHIPASGERGKKTGEQPEKNLDPDEVWVAWMSHELGQSVPPKGDAGGKGEKS